MADAPDGPDGSPIKAVSSLRSRFENMGKDAANGDARNGGKAINATAKGPAPVVKSAGLQGAPVGTNNGLRIPPPPKSRPQSMVDVTPSQKSPPMVTVDAPTSPSPYPSMDFKIGGSRPLTPVSIGSSSPKGHAKTLSRATTPALEGRMAPFMASSNSAAMDPPPKPVWDPSKSIPIAAPRSYPNMPNAPPPVNRAAKPKIPTKPTALTSKPSLPLIEPEKVSKPSNLSAPEQTAAELTDHSASPFSTPPSSREGSPKPDSERGTGPQNTRGQNRRRNESDLSMVGRSRAESKASFVSRIRTDSDASFVERLRSDSNSSFAEPSSLPNHIFQPPPLHHFVAARRDQQESNLSQTPPSRYHGGHHMNSDSPDDRPRLPARPELQVRSGRTSPTKTQSGRTSPSKLAREVTMQRSLDGIRRASTFDESKHTHQKIPAVKPAQISALSLGFDRTSKPSHAAQPPMIPSPRRSMDRREPPPPPAPAIPAVTVPPVTNGNTRHEEVDAAGISSVTSDQPSLSDFPDSSHANRRPPRYPRRPYQIPTDYDTKIVAMNGEYVCTSGYSTKVWTMRTGELLVHMVHTEGVKITSLCFKPAVKLEDQGKRVWLGANSGDLLELDIPSQSIVKTKSNAHGRREVIKMFRHASELWTLDDNGDLKVWKPDQSGMASLDSTAKTFRIPRGQTYSIVCGNHLWVATGKEIRIFLPSARSESEFQVLRSPLCQPGTGDVTSGATISSKPDLVYFGHSDGKVSIYNRHDFSCSAVITVSLYRVSTLAGVGDYLWAGYSTGMAYVYDTSTTPWRVRKDWQAHEKQIYSIITDPSTLAKLDRLQVLSLGTDNTLRIWDGYLEDDWLETRMQDYDTDYCSFNEISAAVLTWNAGATKPHYMQHSPEDSNFFREYLSSGEAPDIFVFGFQELVDLENKRTTAKSFFMSKKSDPSESQHMSHQYRAWRDHLTKCLDDNMPGGHRYTQVHTSSMVGLFSCVFVKSSLRNRIKHIHAAEVKRGMGGLHGNKGAIIMRLVLDDSSICFVNCHLAAGQTQTLHRNNDIAAILEAEALPSYPLGNNNVAAQHSDVFCSGGDGSMVLDHEICILNGDLNYRIDTMGRDTVVKHVHSKNLTRLLERDQLLLSRKKNPGFRLRAFHENAITFPPTYKYNLHTDDYDTSEKRRAPAWCDRILFRGLGRIKMDEYRRWEVKVSDHRPVSGRLRIRVKTVDEQRRPAVWEKCQRELEISRKRVAKAVHLEYLTNVLGLSAQEAAQALK